MKYLLAVLILCVCSFSCTPHSGKCYRDVTVMVGCSICSDLYVDIWYKPSLETITDWRVYKGKASFHVGEYVFKVTDSQTGAVLGCTTSFIHAQPSWVRVDVPNLNCPKAPL